MKELQDRGELGDFVRFIQAAKKKKVAVGRWSKKPRIFGGT